MALSARYVHTNLIAHDWQKLAEFYEQVFGCVPLAPARDLSEPWLEQSTGVKGAHLKGMHLRLPGCGEDGPTLEIFAYQQEMERQPTAANRPGFGHIAFAVDDVDEAVLAVLDAGGSRVGETVSVAIPQAGPLTFAYVTDPEGNIVELQRWG